MTFKPLLAVEADYSTLTYPKLASIKLDGIRCLILNGQAVSRSLKPIPNMFIREALSRPEYEGLDGELLCAAPEDPECYRKTNSAVMSHSGEPEFVFYVFDQHDRTCNYIECLHKLEAVDLPYVKVLEQTPVGSKEDLDTLEAKALAKGHEGVMLRLPDGPYKQGRSTAREQILLKVKRFAQSEARVLDMVEEMENTNEATVDALGHTERSAHKAGMVGKCALGSIYVEDLVTGVKFHIGTGFTRAEREDYWKKGIKGRIVTYAHFPVGVKDAPRFPSFKGFRDKEDMS